ncbi:MAG: TRAP transporter small permease subunit [Chloroflexota bacterium]
MLDKRGNKIWHALGKWTLVMDNISITLQRPFKYAGLIIMGLVTFEVVMRYVFHSPIIWGIDMRSQIYGTALMFAASYTLIVRGHVTIDIIMVNLSLPHARLLEFCNYVIFYAPTVFAIFWSQVLMAMRAWAILENDKTLWAPPIYPMKTLLAVAYFLLFVTGISEAVKDFITFRNGDEEWLKER